MSYLTDYEEIDGGYVAFGGNPKRGKITGRGSLMVKAVFDDGLLVWGTQSYCIALEYSTCRTRIVEENLHVQFSENTPNIARSGPNWLFDIDALTNSMNYKPVVAGNQSNGNAGTKAYDGASKARMESISNLSSDDGRRCGEDSRNSDGMNHEEEVIKTSIELPDDLNIPPLEDIVYSDDDEDVGEEADMNNLDALQVKHKEDGIFISQEKYVTEILKKFGFTDVKTASTPMETQKILFKDEDSEEVDIHLYRSMIGSLMYLTSSTPDIMFVVCAYARYQVNPKVSHLYTLKRIFRYLKGQPKLGLWYPKDSPFDLVAYIDSDYARASLDRKSTTRGCQFLGCRLISWQCKKQTVVANSTTEAEYVAASILVLTTQLRKTVTRKYMLQALVDGKKIIITESIVRRDIQLEDAEVLRLLHGMSLVALWHLQSSV
ncbi:hypothetical protein Tco_0976285 [Tanacetum coccineum]|uniref:Reverse transcriptase Ty1/copia-type domain-containing protein n=1 Tax=Tanacetum coccineum TaxID=301880 RepID=A0ABQ5EGS4_9ASTR